MYFHFVGREPDHCIMSDSCIYSFQYCILIPTCGTSVIRTCTLFSVSVFHIYDYISISFHLTVYLLCGPCLWFSVLYFRCIFLSLSFITYLLDLSLAETVERTYGQWMVYGEFNTLGFVFSPRLTYKFQGRYREIANEEVEETAHFSPNHSSQILPPLRKSNNDNRKRAKSNLN